MTDLSQYFLWTLVAVAIISAVVAGMVAAITHMCCHLRREIGRVHTEISTKCNHMHQRTQQMLSDVLGRLPPKSAPDIQKEPIPNAPTPVVSKPFDAVAARREIHEAMVRQPLMTRTPPSRPTPYRPSSRSSSPDYGTDVATTMALTTAAVALDTSTVCSPDTSSFGGCDVGSSFDSGGGCDCSGF